MRCASAKCDARTLRVSFYVMLRKMVSVAAAGFDVAFAALVLGRSKGSRMASPAESLGHDERMQALAKIAQVYDRPDFYVHPSPFFPDPPAACFTERRVREYGRGGEVVDLTWQSGYACFLPELSARYEEHPANATAAARLFLHRECGHPAAVLIHGYMGGRWSLEERAWPLRTMFERGLDIALVALPFHGVRARSRGRPLFPSSDPRLTIEGFRQAVSDLRTLVSYLESRGSPSVGVMGMSLGGYTAALLATLDPRLAFAVPMIPLASIADFARDGGRLVGTPEQQALQHAALERVHRVVSPLARPSQLSSERVLIVAGEGDRITPMAHARRLAAHFGAPLEVFYGGHILQAGRASAFRAVGRMLRRLGLLASRG